MNKLTGKNILITGASQGLGREMAKGIASTVTLKGRDQNGDVKKWSQ